MNFELNHFEKKLKNHKNQTTKKLKSQFSKKKTFCTE